MSDYNLTGLSTRSFEQLIQALALKVISPRTIIFGDGKDGGREATYEGSTNYLDGETWNGYVVIQAKFCQRPQDTKKDGDWAIDQLKNELEDFSNLAKGRRKPDYYIFTTNVILTPVLDKGSKDKAYKIFEDYQETVPLKGYDIWDYDKIARFLDGHPEIARSYAAWITSGDVLTEVIKALSFQKTNFEKVISNFLQKELIADLYANLEQAGNSQDDKIPLDSVFVDVPISLGSVAETTQYRQEDLIIKRFIESAKHKLDPDTFDCREDISMGSNFLKELRKQDIDARWVVIGGPGQGKTTVSQFLCQLFRVAILRANPKIKNTEVKTAIAKFTSQCQKEQIDLPTVKRFPVRIVLNDFAAKLASDKEPIDSLIDHIVDRIYKRTSTRIVVEDLREWLANYPWLIILDGLDEVPASSNRRQVMEAIQNFWIDANDVNADIMVVATTRPQGYNDDFGTDLYRHVSLAPLSRDGALHYVRRLVQIRYGNDPNRQEKIINQLERASNDAATTRLMQSPLQVTILTILCDRIGQPPKERWKLFSEYHRVIYQREVERDIPASEILSKYQTDIDSIHHQVGLLLQVQSERSSTTDARLSVEDFKTLVRSRLESEGHDGIECQKITKKIIDAAANRLVFLVGLEQKVVGFEIRSLQEFMAAEALMNGNDKQICQRLEEIISIISWRNVVLFAIGKCFGSTDKQHLRDNIHTSCVALNDKDSLSAVTRVGSRLAVEILEDGVVTQQPKYLKLFTRLALSLLDLPPEIIHIRISILYTDVLKSIYIEEIEKRISHGNYQLSLGAWTCLFQLVSLEVDWSIELLQHHWSFTDEEQITIISAITALGVNNKLISQILLDILPRLSPSFVQQKIGWKRIKKIIDTNVGWINYIYSLFNDHFLHKEVPLSFCNACNLIFVSAVFDNTNEDNFNDLNKISDLHPEWEFYTVIFHFINNPSEQTLADALELIFHHQDIFKDSMIRCPWIIKELATASQTPTELLAIAKKVRNGYFGGNTEWKMAEVRWQELGVTERDFLHVTQDGFHFDRHISSIGFPFAALEGFFFRSKDLKETDIVEVSKIINLHQSCKSDIVKTYLLLIPLHFIEHHDIDIKSININDYDILVTMIEYKNQAKKPWFFWQVTAVFNILKQEDRRTEIINSIGEHFDNTIIDYIEDQGFVPELLTTLIDWFVCNPRLLGILNIISGIINSLGQSRTYDGSFYKFQPLLSRIDSELVYLGKPDSIAHQKAEIIVILAKEDLTISDIDGIVEETIKLVGGSAQIIHLMLEIIDQRKFSDPISERFIQQLLAHVHKLKWQEYQAIIEKIDDFLNAKISVLASQQKWNKLGLPSGARHLLPE